jgi:hypothetical protein
MFGNTMFNRLMGFFPRSLIKEALLRYRTDQYCKHFTTWDHLIGMVAVQFLGIRSLRELEVVLHAHPYCHYHLHCGMLHRSTLADANRKRDYRVFQWMAQTLVQRLLVKNKELCQVLTILDSSVIHVTGRGHEWTYATRTRPSAQGLKLHMQYLPQDASIDYVEVTDTNINDITWATQLPLMKHRIYVFDKGYYDYQWWHRIAQQGAHLVTRLKKNAAYTVVEERCIPAEEQHFILSDQIIMLTNTHPRGGKKNPLAYQPLRCITVPHPQRPHDTFTIVSTMLDAPVQHITAYYKQRWAIELLFRWLKQNLNLRQFLGHNRNAIMIQIFSAIIAYALMNHAKRLHATWCNVPRLKDLTTLLHAALFSRPPPRPPPQQHQSFGTNPP